MQFLTGEVVRKLVQQLSRWFLLLCALIKKTHSGSGRDFVNVKKFH